MTALRLVLAYAFVLGTVAAWWVALWRLWRWKERALAHWRGDTP